MKKFRDMTNSEKLEIINAMIAGDRVETTGTNLHWCYATGGVALDRVYRIPKRPMSIDWSVLKDGYICAAREPSGLACAYTKEPFCDERGWDENGGDDTFVHSLKSYDSGTVDWENSLIWRPGFEPK